MEALELLLDNGMSQAVRLEWEALRAAGLPSQANHRGETNAPHITLLATDVLQATDGELTSGLSGLLPVGIRLGPVVTFPGRRLVLARLVVVSADLLAFHAVAVRASDAEPTPFTRPGAWTPHVTLARGLSAEEAGRALSLFGPEAVDGSAVILRRWNSVTRQVSHVVG
ncbi:hypothetical protein JNB_14303 [Janibacter sp. HTCC2649]|uniref:2'-5' RNA ligase family protein n=1 Tax=Janibacter sp. HTCC2649 TaxID=313589 RepID=UPI00006718F4|nr:2'-5' RNA ligase family protein [Janibacter sp. HTCC2649]EAP98143.1 hypothetical protein JNB_14303 [Janibacter sp. HTCC2649]